MRQLDRAEAVKVIVPIRLVSVANISEHWSKSAQRRREHRAECWYSLKAAKIPHMLPCVVTLTRIAPRRLDAHDNLRSSAKGAVDGIADWLNLKTDADHRVEWRYAQRRGEPHEYALEIEVAPQ